MPLPSNMPPKSIMLVVALGVWMYAAVACAALPFFYAVPEIKSIDSIAPLIAALIVGVLVSLPLSIAVRRLSGFGAPGRDVWAAWTAGEAVFFGVVCWGLPLGLMFLLNEFLKGANPFALVSSAIIWPLSGVGFGLLARWLALRRTRGAMA